MVTTDNFHEALAAHSDAQLIELLARRPDLTQPAPTSIAALAARAISRPSTERALSALNAFELQVLESITALATPTTSVSQVYRALGTTARSTTGKQIASVLENLRNCALIWGDDKQLRAAPTVDEVLGPYPAGLGPTYRESLTRTPTDRLRALITDLQLPRQPKDAERDDLVAVLVAELSVPSNISDRTATAPEPARKLLNSLTWNSPVGQVEDAGRLVRAKDAATAVEWLLSRGLLTVAGATHVVLPREVGLVLRGGHTHQALAVSPPSPTGPRVRPDAAASNAALIAEDFSRNLNEFLTEVSDNPPTVLRSGGLGLRDVKRLARHLSVAEQELVSIAEIAHGTGLIADDGADTPHWLPAMAADDLTELPAAERWARVAIAWFSSTRTPWLVGTRDTKGELRPALHPDMSRPWASSLRRQLIEVLAAFPDRALTSDDILAQLTWSSPRSVPPSHVVDSLLHEASVLGIVAEGTLAPAGASALAGQLDEAARILANTLPPAVDEVLVQPDLTAVVPGRPSPELVMWLGLLTNVESRGPSSVYRFTAGSIRRGLDSGRSATELITGLAQHSRAPLPAALEELILEESRSHGQLRVGAASAYIRAEDPSIIAALASDAAMAPLGLLLLAPTVLAAQMPPGTVVELLKSRGLAPGLEGPDGHLVVRVGARRRITGKRGSAVAGGAMPLRVLDDVGRRELVAQMRAGEHRGPRRPGARGSVPTSDPSIVLATLREAAEAGAVVEIVVAGTDGAPRRRKVRPMAIDGGRLRALDVARAEEEMLVSINRIGAAVRLRD